MSKDKISDYSATANSNTDIGGINIDEGCAPSGINDAIRTLMKQLKDFQQGTNGDSFNGPHNGTVGATTPAAGTFTSVTTPIVGSASGASLALKTNGGTTAVTIDTSQNVGIGTSSPAYRLDVSTSSADATQISKGASDGYFTQYKEGTTLVGYIYSSTGSSNPLRIGAGNPKPLTLETSGIERMRIDSSGNVGIGTSSPVSVSNSKVLTINGTNSSQIYLQAGGASYGVLYATPSEYSIYGIGAIPMRFFTNDTERMRIDSSGNLLVGTTSSTFSTSPASTGLQIQNTGQIWPNTAYAVKDNIVCATTGTVSGSHTFISFYAGGSNKGSINFNGSTLAYSTSSDYRLKENIAPMTGALDKVAQLKPCTYTWKTDGIASQGFIAHELQAVVPDCVTGEKDAVDADGNPVYQGIDTSFLVATLTAAIQEQQAIIETLTNRIQALENK